MGGGNRVGVCVVGVMCCVGGGGRGSGGVRTVSFFKTFRFTFPARASVSDCDPLMVLRQLRGNCCFVISLRILLVFHLIHGKCAMQIALKRCWPLINFR